MIDSPKQELRKLWMLELRVTLKCEELDKIESQVNRVSRWAVDERVQGGRSGHEDLLMKLIDLRQDANKMIDELIDEKKRVQAIIDQIDDPMLAEILIERYFECRSWPEIAINTHCSERNVYYLHGKALQAYGEKLAVFCSITRVTMD